MTSKVFVASLDAGEFALTAEAVPTVTGFGNNVQNVGDGNVYTYPGAPITITGRGFSQNSALTKVTIGPFECKIESATVNSITVMAPFGFAGQPWGIHQPVKVWVNGNRAQNALYINIYNQTGNGG
ncbi:MAG: IPT/TIG domain-containing protein [Candidatus Obscuribacterales bacterium]|nr:IPT/TIG domain-containing protein [Candidatus Obscuribacterales bacterium]